jgi:hypothetical protein
MTSQPALAPRAVGYGLLWGLTVTANEALALPFSRPQTRRNPG